MEKAAIGTNDLGMHIVIRPISKDLLSKDEIIGMETGKINSLLTARRPITLVDAITALPPLLPSSADPITGRRLYSIEEIMSGSCGIHFGPPVPELLRYETELSKFICAYKSASSRLLKKEFPEIRCKLWKEYFWSRSFCLLTTGGAPIDVIHRYIESQGRK